MLGVFIGLLLLFFILGIPVAFSIGYTCLMVIIAGSGLKDLSFDLFALQMMDGINSFPLISASFFVLAANVMNTSAITDRIFHFANALVGHLRGGLGHVNVVGSMIFAGMSGTAVADAAGLGNIEIKAMRDAGYPMPLTVGITGASSILGPIIPPSIAMIFYGWLAGVSIGDLFIGGVIPGVVIALFMMVQVYFVSLKHKDPPDPPASGQGHVHLFPTGLSIPPDPGDHHRGHLLGNFQPHRVGGCGFGLCRPPGAGHLPDDHRKRTSQGDQGFRGVHRHPHAHHGLLRDLRLAPGERQDSPDGCGGDC